MRRGKKGGGSEEIRKVKDNNEYLVRPSMFILHCKKRGKVGREREKAKERERERERERELSVNYSHCVSVQEGLYKIRNLIR